MQPAARAALKAYYTPGSVVTRALDALPPLRPGARVLDLSCGDGIWLAGAARRWPRARLAGVDIDLEAVAAATERLPAGTDLEVADGLTYPVASSERPDLVVGNPPWGLGRSAGVRRGDESASRFLLRALELLAPGGRLCLLLPAAWLEVAAHREARERLLALAAVERLEHLGDVFPGVMAPAALVVARREPDAATRAAQWVETPRGQVAQAELERDPERALNPRLGPGDRALLCKLDARAQRMAGRVTFILGVVTGRNREALGSQAGEPIVTGPDVGPFEIRAPRRHLLVPLEDVQQAAPRAAYRRQKVIYRFIARRPVAALDGDGRLTLNSANAFAVDDPTLDPHFLVAALNSTPLGFAHAARHAMPRLLRSHLERLPLPRVSAGDARALGQLAELRGAAAAEELDDRMMDLFALSPSERARAKALCPGS